MDGKICANTFFHQEFFDIRKEREASRSSCILRVQRSNCSNKNFDGEKFSAKELARARYLLPSGDTKNANLRKEGRKASIVTLVAVQIFRQKNYVGVWRA